MGLLAYIASVLKLAFWHAPDRADTVSGFGGAILYGVGKLFKVETIVNIDWWWLPLFILGIIYAIRLLLSPYWMYRKVEGQRDELLGATSKNGIVVLNPPPPSVRIMIGDIEFGLSGDSGYPQLKSGEPKARWVRLSLTLQYNVLIETLELIISGKEPILASEWKPGGIVYYHYFQIPNWVKHGEQRTIQVRAFANGVTWGSLETPINFP